MSYRTFLLQKDTPTAKAGSKYINNQAHIPHIYFLDGDYRTSSIYLEGHVIDNPEWFVEVFEENKISHQ